MRDHNETLEEYFMPLPEDEQLLNLLLCMVAYEPADRHTAAELLTHAFFTAPKPTSVGSKVVAPGVRLDLPSVGPTAAPENTVQGASVAEGHRARGCPDGE